MRTALVLLLAITSAGCTNRVFTNLGNNSAVSPASIDDYATRNGISRDEAREEMRAHDDLTRIHEHAEKYGVTLEEAQQQIEHAAARP